MPCPMRETLRKWLIQRARSVRCTSIDHLSVLRHFAGVKHLAERPAKGVFEINLIYRRGTGIAYVSVEDNSLLYRSTETAGFHRSCGNSTNFVTVVPSSNTTTSCSTTFFLKCGNSLNLRNQYRTPKDILPIVSSLPRSL